MRGELINSGLHLELKLVGSRWMAPLLVHLKERYLWKDKSYLAMLVSMIMWVDWMVDNSALCFQLGLDLAAVMANH